MRRIVFAAALTLACLGATAQLAEAKPQRGTIRMRDGRVFEDVLYEVRGRRVWVKRSLGEVTYDMAQIAKIVPTEADGPDLGSAEIDRPGADWLGRFQLDPPEDWKVVKPGMPGVRAQLRHKRRDAIFMVRVFPIEKPFAFTRNEERDVLSKLRADLSRLYQRAAGSKLKVGELHGNPVYHLTNTTVRAHGTESRDPERNLEEIRFQRLGLEYSLLYEVAEDDAGALETELPELFASFSFLPALVIEDTLYADLTRGFALATLPEWKATVRPFDNTRPLSLQNDDGRASLDVEVVVGTDALQVVRSRIDKRGSTSKVEVEAATLNGSDVVQFSFNGFRKGGRSLLGFRGYAASTGGQTVVLTGIAPLSDRDSPELVNQIESMLESFRARKVEKLTAQARQGRAALELLAQASEALTKRRESEAIQRLGEAIQTDPGFALAYYLRGLARKEQGDFEGYKQDLTKAGELAPGAGYTKALAGALKEEAEAAHRARDYDKSLELHARLLEGGEGDLDDARKKMLDAIRGIYGDMRRKKNWDKWKELDSSLRGFKDDPEIQKAHLDLLLKIARELARADEHSDSKRVLRAAKRALRGLRRDKEYDKLEADYDKVDQDLDRMRKR